MGSKFSHAFLETFDIHRAVQTLDRNADDPIDLGEVIESLKREGVAPSLTDEELAAAVIEAAREAGVPLILAGRELSIAGGDLDHAPELSVTKKELRVPNSEL